MTAHFMGQMDNVYLWVLVNYEAAIHARRRGFTRAAAARSGLRMALIVIAMRHSQRVTMQYILLSVAAIAMIITRIGIAS